MSTFGSRRMTATECATRADAAARQAQRSHEMQQMAARDHYISESVNWFVLAWMGGWGK